ncbi:hypothetical protein Pan161_59980 [Gimesia algae]|uniref:Uncharacterized protein n=1 Tax=Gimesia algae TaxID=2527971 RepID=A0A517VMR1_9PLAN|nr:hypothetical protein Pan161_59980 [Gimesia algae]
MNDVAQCYQHVLRFNLKSRASLAVSQITIHAGPEQLRAEWFRGLCDAWLCFGFQVESVEHRRDYETEFKVRNTHELFPPEWDRS